MKHSRTNLQATLVSDSDSEDEAPALRNRDRREDFIHRAIRTDLKLQGRTRIAAERVIVPASPTKAKRAPGRDLLASDWPSHEDFPFPFADEDFLAFDAAHPLDPGRGEILCESIIGLSYYFTRESELITSKEGHPMAQWVPRHQRFLEELLRLQGRDDHRHQSKCANCDVAAAAAVWPCTEIVSQTPGLPGEPPP
jgi:hypothetical protein